MAKGKKAEKALKPEEKLAQALVLTEEQPYSVPGNWCWVQWGICGQFIAGNGFKSEFQGFTEYSIPFYKVGSLRYIDTESYLYDLTNTVNEELRTRLKASLIPVNSILFAKIGEAIKLNRRALNAVPCCIDNNMMAFVPGVCNHKYVLYWSMGLDLYDYTNATTVPAIRKSDLEGIPFPLAPLSEQQRIVVRIESLFAKLDAAKERAQAVVDGFETRKAAILHRAFAGKLTAQWRHHYGIHIESWEKRELTEDFEIAGGIQKTPLRTPQSNSVPYLTVANVFRDRIDISNVRYFEIFDGELEKFRLKEKDILIVEGNGSGNEIGRCAIWRNELPVCIHQNHIIRLRQKTNRILPEYVLLFLNSSSGKSIMKARAKTTAGLFNLSTGKIRSIPVPYPSLSEQMEIVRISKALIDKESSAKESAESVLAQIDTMKKSILARAFRGELGTNDPAEEWAGELVREALKSDVPRQPRAKAVFIPKELEMQLESELERKIIKLYLKNDSDTVAIGVLMAVSSKKFEVMDALHNLEQRGIIKKINNGNYSLMR